MDPKDMMPVEMSDRTMWTLSSDRKTVRLAYRRSALPVWLSRSAPSWTSTLKQSTPCWNA